MLADLVVVDESADPQADLLLPPQRPLQPPGGRHDRIQQPLRAVQQLQPFAGPLLGKQRIAADDQPLPWVVGRADLQEVSLIEKR